MVHTRRDLHERLASARPLTGSMMRPLRTHRSSVTSSRECGRYSLQLVNLTTVPPCVRRRRRGVSVCARTNLALAAVEAAVAIVRRLMHARSGAMGARSVILADSPRPPTAHTTSAASAGGWERGDASRRRARRASRLSAPPRPLRSQASRAKLDDCLKYAWACTRCQTSTQLGRTGGLWGSAALSPKMHAVLHVLEIDTRSSYTNVKSKIPPHQ